MMENEQEKTPAPLKGSLHASRHRRFQACPITVLLAIVMLIASAKVVHRVWLNGANQDLSQRQLVRAVTANTVMRPKVGVLATAPTTMQASQGDKGQADCPT